MGEWAAAVFLVLKYHIKYDILVGFDRFYLLQLSKLSSIPGCLHFGDVKYYKILFPDLLQ